MNSSAEQPTSYLGASKRLDEAKTIMIKLQEEIAGLNEQLKIATQGWIESQAMNRKLLEMLEAKDEAQAKADAPSKVKAKQTA